MELVLKDMRKKRWAGRAAAILLVSVFCLFWLSQEGMGARRPMTVKIGRGEAKVTALEGTAQVVPGESARRRPLKVGGILRGGYQVTTGPKSRLEIALPDGSVLRFADNASFKIIEIDVSAEANTRTAKVNMALGKTWANVSKTFGVKPNIEVASENAVAGVRGTIYRMNVNEDQSALVRVYDGEVAVSGGGKKAADLSKPAGPPTSISGPVSIPGPQSVTMEKWVQIVRAMQQIRVSATGIPSQPESFTEAEDKEAWVDWNRARDENVLTSDNASEEAPGEKSEGGFFNWFR